MNVVYINSNMTMDLNIIYPCKNARVFSPLVLPENNGNVAVKHFSAEYTEDANQARYKTLTASVEQIFLERVTPDSKHKT